ncbi:MAG: hypothetical protein QM778_14775 [Myxococcales bacterium]
MFGSSARCQRLGMWFVLSVMLSALLMVIIDLDCPGVGIIPVNHGTMYYQRSRMRRGELTDAC